MPANLPKGLKVVAATQLLDYQRFTWANKQSKHTTGKAAATCNSMCIKDLGGASTHKTTKQTCRPVTT